jgi:transposase
MNSDERQEIQKLFQNHMSIRSIARRLGRDPKTIRRALGRPRRSRAATPAPKLEPFHDLIAQMATQDLTAPRILRELRTRGYSGGLTILKEHLRQLRGASKPPRPVFRRFETRPAEEGQVDWSPYRLRIGTEEMVVHCFSMILGYSRRLWIGFYRNERHSSRHASSSVKSRRTVTEFPSRRWRPASWRVFPWPRLSCSA